tara:strand:- start:1443 stop:2381 length:939 start_codon:yes stop_codon:yes gene_type:complete
MSEAEKEAQIQEYMNAGLGREQAEELFKSKYPEGNGQEGIVDGVTTKNNIPFELSGAGKIGVGAKGASVLGDIYSLATANKRQGETVDRYKDLATKYGESAEVDPSAVNLATLNAGDKSDARTSTLATLLDQGVDPAAASKIIQAQKAKDTSALLNVLGQYGQQKGAAQMQADRNAMKFDAMAAQADTPIDYGQSISGILGKTGDFGLGLESLLNPLPTASVRSGMKMKYEDGGNLQTTQGASDHSENPMMVTNKDGSPAVDEEGNQIEVTGKETIIPDWLMEQLIAAAKKGPKELDKVFKDEIIDEERFQA